jgi:hypothetical protein
MSLIESILARLIDPLVRYWPMTINPALAISSQGARQAAAVGGGLAGLLMAVLVTVLRGDWTGFDNLPRAELSWNLPLIVFCALASGALGGWLCGWAAYPPSGEHRRAKGLRSVLILVAGFAITFLAHQLGARDALVLPGCYIRVLDERGEPLRISFPERLDLRKKAIIDKMTRSENGIWIEQGTLPDGTHRTFVRSGGPLGEPDFEGLATGSLGAVALLVFVSLLRRWPLPTKASAAKIIMTALVFGGMAFGFVGALFETSIRMGLLTEGTAPFGSRAVFCVEFPHPVRIFLDLGLIGVYTACVMMSILLHAEERRILLS